MAQQRCTTCLYNARIATILVECLVKQQPYGNFIAFYMKKNCLRFSNHGVMFSIWSRDHYVMVSVFLVITIC